MVNAGQYLFQAVDRSEKVFVQVRREPAETGCHIDKETLLGEGAGDQLVETATESEHMQRVVSLARFPEQRYLFAAQKAKAFVRVGANFESEIVPAGCGQLIFPIRVLVRQIHGVIGDDQPIEADGFGGGAGIGHRVAVLLDVVGVVGMVVRIAVVPLRGVAQR